MKNLTLTILACLFTLALSAQAEVVATVADSTGTTLPGANAVLLRAQDSLLTSFGTTDVDGRFRMENVPAGDYILRITFLGYERPDQPLNITADDQYFDLGTVKMYPAGFFLNGVEVTADRIPIRMRGDTMLYDADAFAVGENAVVEDLLRRLPGMAVDASGQITWRGKPISEVMINGKPFFAGNSTLLTQNLEAKAITNVEVFDKKTDAEEISGIDDGEENMAVNLEMKEEFKAKVFGEVYAGGGGSADFGDGSGSSANNDPRYQAGGKLFRISDATQIGILTTVNNINQVGFSGDEISGFNGSSGRGRFAGFDGEGSLPYDSGNATGQNRSIATGVNFGRTVGKNGQLTADYALFDRNQVQASTTLQAFNRANDKRVVETLEGTATGQYSHRLGFEFRQRVDSTARLTISGAAFLTGGDNETQAITTINNDGSEIEDYNVRELNENERPGGEINISYNKGGRERGRRFGSGRPQGKARTTWSVNASASRQENRSDLDLLTEGLSENTEVVGALVNGQQIQDRRTTSTNLGLNAEVTKPLAEKLRLQLGGGYATDRDEGDYRFRQAEETAVNLLDRSWNSARARASLIREVGKGGNISFGAQAQSSQLLLEGDEMSDERYNYILPFIRFRKRLKKGFTRFNIGTSVRAPSIAQLQTIVEPNASGRASVGNPNLTPAVNHNAGGNLWYNDQFRAVSANIGLNATYTDNAFGNSVNFTRGQQIYRPVNVSHAWSGRLYTGATIGINAIDGEFRVNAGLNGSRGQGFVDGLPQLNTTINYNAGANITTELNEDSFVKFGYSFNNYSNSFEGENNRNTDIDQRTHDLLAQFELELNPKWRFESRFMYSIYEESDFAAGQNIPDLRMSFEVRPFRKKGHYFRISASDIFNQNTIINRRVNAFVTTETTSDGLGRYFLGTFFYKI